jgi:hypothetical protein
VGVERQHRQPLAGAGQRIRGDPGQHQRPHADQHQDESRQCSSRPGLQPGHGREGNNRREQAWGQNRTKNNKLGERKVSIKPEEKIRQQDDCGAQHDDNGERGDPGRVVHGEDDERVALAQWLRGR